MKHLLGLDGSTGSILSRPYSVVMGGEQIGHLLIELAEMVLDYLGFFEREPIVSTFPKVSTRSDQAL